MAIGRCDYMTCASMLASHFRATFWLGTYSQPRRADREVMLCGIHESECRQLRDKMPGNLMLTDEGWVYSKLWMEALPR